MKTSMIRPAARPKPTPRTHLEIGSLIFHNGAPVQLLYRGLTTKNQETWRVRPLFVEAPDRNEKFRPSDLVPTHDQDTCLDRCSVSRGDLVRALGNRLFGSERDALT